MNSLKIIGTTVLLLGSIACSTSTTTAQGIAATPPQKPAVQTSPGTSPGKPSAPVTVEFQPLGSVISIGTPISIRTLVTPTADVDVLEVRFSLSNGLAAVGNLPVLRLNTQKPGTALSQTVVFSPLAEGQQYLNVFVSTVHGAQRMTKTVSFPIDVGDVAANKPASPMLTTPDGERVVSMPATEPK